ncbi:helix-turn-helix domain-containing protein [Streptomyces sp. 796.1]|uniref:helix-turn-helix domain-containing protein n=1 Tax=Streptomyces sp. 796.1 TaxID=3163029 RepID=UPI0039C95893
MIHIRQHGDALPSDQQQAAGAGQAGIAVRLPRAVLPSPVAERRPEQALARSLPAASGFGGLLNSFLHGVVGQTAHLDEAQAHRLGVATIELVTAFLAQHTDGGAPTPPEMRRGLTLARIDAYIHENLAAPELTPAAIAAHHHISVRSLHALFHRRGRTVAATIRHLRLERCRAALADPQWSAVPVRAIAARWGYPDATVFSRAFRTAYGLPPNTYRRTVAEAERPSGDRAPLDHA